MLAHMDEGVWQCKAEMNDTMSSLHKRRKRSFRCLFTACFHKIQQHTPLPWEDTGPCRMPGRELAHCHGQTLIPDMQFDNTLGLEGNHEANSNLSLSRNLQRDHAELPPASLAAGAHIHLQCQNLTHLSQQDSAAWWYG